MPSLYRNILEGVTTIPIKGLGLKRGESPNPKRYHLFELAIFSQIRRDGLFLMVTEGR